MKLHALIPLAVAVAIATPHQADTITGQVVDSIGNPVANVNIDAFNTVTGEDETLSGDFTDANGFFTTTIPAGIYDLSFLPPSPPTTTHLAATQDAVVVVNVTNLGTITLPPGVALSGRCINAGGNPVAGVDIDVFDETTKKQLVLTNDDTDAFGNFLVAVPTSEIEVRFDTLRVTSQMLAPQATVVTPTGTTNLGDVVLPPGFDVSGFVRRTNGSAVTGCDIDVRETATGDKIWTPSDNTDGSGFFDVRLAAGTWDVEACPDLSTVLVPAAIRSVVVSGNQSVGVITTPNGAVLSGTITGFDGSIQPNADVDAEDAFGADILLCNDNADENGDYALVVPIDTLTISFEPPNFQTPYGADVHPGVVIGGPTVLDGVLPSCPGGQNYGVGLAGTGGVVPHLTDGGGSPRAGNDDGYFWSLEDGRGGGTAILMASIGQLNVPALGGTLLVNILPGQYSAFLVILDGTPGAAGAGSATFPVPVPLEMLAGVTLYGQFGVLDGAAPANVALSDGMAVLFCL